MVSLIIHTIYLLDAGLIATAKMERPLRVRSPATILVLAQGQSGPAHPTRSSLGQFGPGHPDRSWGQFGPGHPVRSWGQLGPGHPVRSSGQFGPGHPDRFRRGALFDPRQNPSSVLQPLKSHAQHVASSVHCTPWPGTFSKQAPALVKPTMAAMRTRAPM